MATKSISQLDTQATANETDLFEVAIVDQNSASGYASKKESAAAIADAIVGSYQYPLRITGTTAKTIAGAINELKNLVDLLPQFAIEVVQTLPVSDISETTIYLVPASDPEQGNYYEEYIYVNNAWELVGTTAVDLSGYYTSAQTDTLLAAKANSADLATVATSGAYSDLSGKPTIDTQLDTTSTNAVENRAVASEINSIKSDISVEGSASGDIATFVDGSDNPLKELKISIVATQSGSGDPSPENERPIIGFNAVNVGDISDAEKLQYFKGLLDGTYAFVDLGSLTYTNSSVPVGEIPVRYYSNEIADIKPPVNNDTVANILCPTYKTVAVNNMDSQSENMLIGVSTIKRIYARNTNYADKDSFKAAMSGVYLIYELATPTTPTITPTEFNTLVSAFGLQGWLVQITMPTEAGTVYGGQLDVKNGTLTVTHKFHEFVGAPSENWYTYGNSGFRVPINDISAENDGICNIAHKVTSANYYGVSFSSQNNYIYFFQSVSEWGVTTLSELQTWLSTHHIQVCYKTTPTTYQLTPTEVRSLLGINNIWADCGDITELKYTRDLNLCINDIIARIEALEGGSNNRSLSISPTLTKSLTSEIDEAEGKAEETEEETKEEAQKNER